MPVIIDRRKSGKDKHLVDRQRFIERYRSRIKEAVNSSTKNRSISDTGGHEVNVANEIDEPTLGHDRSTGEHDFVVPGNKQYSAGDTIPKPKGGGGGGSGGKKPGESDTETEDSFKFVLSYDEFMDIYFGDLKLHDLTRTSQATLVQHIMRRAGFNTSGVPTNLNVQRTAIAAMSRRIALRNPKTTRVLELEALLEDETDEEKRLELEEEISRLKIAAAAVSYFDNTDLRYNNFVKDPKPITRAVIFFVLDVSSSMDERKKTIAKKFFILLNMFLGRGGYKDVEIVFVRHHDTAAVCTEEEFFVKQDSGGTQVNSAYTEVLKVIKEKYDDTWNIYVAQASDGDSYDHYTPNGRQKCEASLNKILDLVQYMYYLEVPEAHQLLYRSTTPSDLGEMIIKAEHTHKNVAMRLCADEASIVRVFRSYFTEDKPS